MNKGDIILVRFPFTDFSGDKLRPSLVLVQNTLDVMVAFMTTKFLQIGTHDILLKKSSFSFLKKDSLLKVTKITTVDIRFSAGRIGNLDVETMKAVDKKLIELFQINTASLNS